MIAIFSKGISGGVLELAKEIKAGHFKLLLITNQESVEKMNTLGLFDEIIGLPMPEMYNAQKNFECFSSAFRKNNIRTVFSCYDPCGPVVCDILKTHYGVGPEIDRLKLCYMKSEVRKQLSKHSVDDLPFFVMKNQQDLEALRSKLNTSWRNGWILKPSFGTSSELVSPPLSSYDELQQFYVSVLKRGRPHIKEMWVDNINWAEVYLLEKYVDGEEYSVEGVCVGDNILIAGVVQKQGLTIINGIRSEGVNFTPIKNEERFQSLSDLAKKTVATLQISNSPFHIEMRWDKSSNRPRIIEINPRLPGGLLCNIHHDRHGINLAKLFLHSRLGMQSCSTAFTRDNRFYGDLPLPTTKKGVYRGASIPNEFIREASACGDVEIIDFLNHGEPVDPRHSEVYFAHAYIKAPTEDAFWKAVKLCERISPIIDEH